MNCRYQLRADALMALSVAPGWAVCVCLLCVRVASLTRTARQASMWTLAAGVEDVRGRQRGFMGD